MSRLRRGIGVLGELLVTCGVIVLLFGAYELWGTGVYTANQQAGLKNDLSTAWDVPTIELPSGSASPTPGSTAAPTPTPSRIAIHDVPIGHGIAVLRIPRLGKDYEKVIVQGVGVEDLKRGPGHVPTSADPGAIGNFVLSGHRTTYGAPFNRIDELHVGDPIVVQTADSWFVYRVTSSEVVAPTAVDVIAPVPHHPGDAPTTAVMTMTTCNPKFSARQRLIVYAALAETTPISSGPPAALAGG